MRNHLYYSFGAYDSKTHSEISYIANFYKHDKTQILAKFKKIPYIRFGATLNVQSGGSEPYVQNFLKL